MIGVAAIVGHANRAVILAQGFVSSFQVFAGVMARPPLPVATAAIALNGFAAFGAPADSVGAARSRLSQAIAAYVAPADSARYNTALVALPASLLFPSEGGVLAGLQNVADPIAHAQQRFAAGDRVGARRELTDQLRTSEGYLSASIPIDGVYRRARLSLALGDTVVAIRHLDHVLGALPTLDIKLLDQIEQAAMLVRAMALRAELGDRLKDRATARHWAGNVVVLWDGGDAALQPLVSQMKTLMLR
jgi:hypothetical protein